MLLKTISLVAGVLLSMLIPYYFKQFFDVLTLAESPDMIADRLIHLVWIILMIELFEWFFWRIATFCVSYFQPRVMKEVADETFQYLLGHSFQFFNEHFIGSLVKKVGRLMRSFEVFHDKLYWDLIPLFLRVSIIFGVLVWLQPWIGFAMLVWTFLFLYFNYRFSLYKWKYDIARARLDSKVSGALADVFTNHANVKLFVTAKREHRRFFQLTQQWFKATRLEWDIGSVAEAIQSFLMIMLEIAVLYLSVHFWKKGVIQIGDFAWIQLYLIELFRQLWNFGRIIRDLYQSFADADETMELLETPHDIQDVPLASTLVVTQGAIDFDRVTFAYQDSAPVIHELSLSIKPGEKIALIGPSGSGKSTITKLLMRLYDYQSGILSIDGQDIRQVTTDSLRSQIAFVPQDPILFHRSLLENIRYGRLNATDQEVIAAAKLAHCHEFITRFPDQYQTHVGERGVKLSGGERQRVAIARAFLAERPLLILDEATSSLDSESEQFIQEALEKLMKGKTTLVIAHRLSTIMKMDRIVVLHNGGIIEEGAHDDLLSKKSGLYKKLWDLQVGGYIND
ncbi:ABC transporter ATP-binding protein [Candidatus Peregrinibacteria bacterium]|nr:MAG: ABC transporter ATP-binding protein [Candidatus Peregrinibacteria bacterium]